MKKRYVALILAAACLTMLCACKRGETAASVSSSTASQPAQAASSAEPTPSPAPLDGGKALPEGQLYCIADYDADTSQQYGPAILSGDKTIFEAKSGETAIVLEDLATGTAAYYAAGAAGADGSFASCTVYDAAGKSVYTCEDGEQPLLIDNGWLLTGTFSNKTGVYAKTVFTELASGTAKDGPQNVRGGDELNYGPAPDGGFWISLQGKKTKSTVVQFYGKDAEKGASATVANADSYVQGFLGNTAYLASGSDLVPLELGTGKTGKTLKNTEITWLGFDTYQGLYHDKKTDIYRAGELVSTMDGWVMFTNGKLTLVSAQSREALNPAGAYEYGASQESGLSILLADGTSQEVTGAAWNTVTGQIAVQYADRVDIYGSDGTQQGSIVPGGENTQYALLENGLLVEAADKDGKTIVTAYRDGSVAWAHTMAGTCVLWTEPGSNIPVLYSNDGTRTAVLQDGTLYVDCLASCVPLSDGRMAVRQGTTFGLMDAAGRWMWSQESGS